MLAWTGQVKYRGLSEQPNYSSGGYKVIQHETHNWDNLDKCEIQHRVSTKSMLPVGKAEILQRHYENMPMQYTEIF